MKSLRFRHTDDLNNPLAFKEVFPLSSKEFEDKKDKKEVFYRRKSSGKYRFVNDASKGIDDYNFFFAFEQSVIERCRTRFIVVEELCNGVWKQVHLGKFSMNDGDWDLDRCEVEIKVKEVDRYSCIKDHKSDEFNILTVGPIITTTAPKDTPFEFICCRPCDLINCYTGPNPATWSSFYEECTPLFPGTSAAIYTDPQRAEECSISTTYAAYTFNQISNEVRIVNLATGTPTTIASGLGTFNILDTEGDYVVYTDRNSVRDVYLYKISTATTTLIDSALSASSFGHSFLKIQNDKVVFYENSGGVGRRLKIYDINTATLTTIFTNPGSGFGLNPNSITYANNNVAYYDGDTHTYSSYDVITTITTVILTLMTSPPAFNKQNSDYLGFYATHNSTVYSYKFSSNTLTIIQAGVGAVGNASMSATYYCWVDFTSPAPSELYYYNLTTNVNTNTGFPDAIIQGQPYGMDNNDSYIVFHDTGTHDLIYYDISLNTFTIFDNQNSGAPSMLINENDSIVWQNSVSNNLWEHNIPTGIQTNITNDANQPPFCMEDNGISGQFIINANAITDTVYVWNGAVENTTKIKVWFREIRTTLCINGAPASPLGGGWVVEEDNCATLGTAKWVRPPAAIVAPTIQIQLCICDPQGCEPTPPTIPGQWLLVCGCTQADPRAFYWKLPEDVVYNRGRLLKDAVEGLISTFCPEINGIVSNFFQWNPTNPSSINYVTGLSSEVNYLTINQKSDIRTPNSSEPATIGNLKWKDLVDWLRIMFEVYYFIDDNNTLHFEHISVIQNNIGLDLTQGKFDKWQKNNRQYSYKKSEMFKLEKFAFAEQENIDNVGYSIDYKDATGEFSLCVNDDEKEHKAVKLTTDLVLAQNNPGALAREGFFLMANAFDGVNYTVISAVGKVTGQLIINSPLGWSNLQEAFLKWNRILLEGEMNRVFQPFNSAQRFKEQKKFKIPLCCDDNYNPVDFMVTDLGIGQVKTGSRDFKNNTLEIKLLYE